MEDSASGATVELTTMTEADRLIGDDDDGDENNVACGVAGVVRKAWHTEARCQ